MKNRFDFEQEIMGAWSVVDDLKLLHVGVLERDLTPDQISNILSGMTDLYQMKFEILFETFGSLVRDKEI